MKKNDWLFIIPISNMEIFGGKASIKIDRVTFTSATSLSRQTRDHGFTKRLKDVIRTHDISKEMNDYRSFSLIRCRGAEDEADQQALQLAREELMIVAATNLYRSDRNFDHRVGLSMDVGSVIGHYLQLACDEHRYSATFLAKDNLPVQFDDVWWQNYVRSGWKKVVERMRHGSDVTIGWRRLLRRVAILLGQSVNAQDGRTAFLNNMIALEMMLTRRGEKVGDTLPERSRAFLGWSLGWGDSDLMVEEVYSLRNDIVHEGDFSGLKLKHLRFTDHLLGNLVTNICGSERFKSKDDVISFVKHAEAERVMNENGKLRKKFLSVQTLMLTPRQHELAERSL